MKSGFAVFTRIALEALERYRDSMERYVPDCLVEDYEGLMATVELPNVDDRHVLAPSKLAPVRSSTMKVCPETGLPLERGVRSLVLTCKDQSVTVICARWRQQRSYYER